MSRSASYGKTVLNNKSEDLALKMLLKSNSSFQRPDLETRKAILVALGLANKFSPQVFDLVQSDVPIPPLTSSNAKDHIDILRLVEVKATKKAIVDENLHGFFFGATENQYRLAKLLGDRYKFAFVVLNPKGGRPPFFVLLTKEEVDERTKTKRIQYQVNFRGRPRP